MHMAVRMIWSYVCVLHVNARGGHCYFYGPRAILFSKAVLVCVCVSCAQVFALLFIYACILCVYVCECKFTHAGV